MVGETKLCLGFEGVSTTDVEDYSDNRATGSFSGSLVRKSGLFDTSLEFDGSTGYIYISNPANDIPSGSASFTIDTWSYADTTNNRCILSYGGTTNNEANILSLSGSNIVHSFYGGGSRLLHDYGDMTGSWVYVAVTFDGTTRKLYINGDEEETDTPSPNVDSPSSLNIYIGKDITTGLGYYDGMLDELRILNTVLTASEIEDSYNRGVRESSGLSNPLRMEVRVTGSDKDGNPLTYTSGTEFVEGDVKIALNEKADIFNIKVDNKGNQYSSLFDIGNVVEIWCDTRIPPCDKVLTGIVDEIKIERPKYNINWLNLSGQDYMMKILQRIVVKSYQEATGAPVTVKPSNVVCDLMGDYASDISTGSVNTTDDIVTLKDLRFPYVSLSECMKQLSELSGFWSYYVDPYRTLHYFDSETRDSGLLFSAGKNLVRSNFQTEYREMKNRIFVIGGTELVVDQQSTTVTNQNYRMHPYYTVRMFKPTQSSLRELAIYMRKTGSPTGNLTGEIREGGGGKVATLSWNRNNIGLTADWYATGINLINLPSGPYTMNTNRTYWMQLDKVGDASNTYIWYNDGGSISTIYTSVDGITWGIHSTGSEFSFKSYYGIPVIAEARDAVSIDKYGYREAVYKDTAILSRETARKLANARLEELRELKRRHKATVLCPYGRLRTGDLVTIYDADIGEDYEQYVVNEIGYKVKPALETYTINLSLSLRRMTISEILRGIFTELRRTSLGESGVDVTTLVDHYEDMIYPFSLSDIASGVPYNYDLFYIEGYDSEDDLSATGSAWTAKEGDWGILSSTLSGSNTTDQYSILSGSSYSNYTYHVVEFNPVNTGSGTGSVSIYWNSTANNEDKYEFEIDIANRKLNFRRWTGGTRGGPLKSVDSPFVFDVGIGAWYYALIYQTGSVIRLKAWTGSYEPYHMGWMITASDGGLSSGYYGLGGYYGRTYFRDYKNWHLTIAGCSISNVA